MWRITRAHLQPIGIDIGHDAVKMLQLEASGESLVVRAAARQPFPAEARGNAELRLPVAMDLIRRTLRERCFTGRRAVLAIPREILHVKSLRLPSMPATELESAVRFEAQPLFAFPLDDATVCHLPAGEVRQGSDIVQEVMVLAARRLDVDNFVEQAHHAGILVDSLDIEHSALFRTVDRFVRRREDEVELNVLADVGMDLTQVVIGKGREISFLKSIDIGGAQFNDAVARKLSISTDEAQALRRRFAENPEPTTPGKRDPVRQAVLDATRSVMEQLGREVSLCLRYHQVTFRGHRPARLRLTGGESADLQLQTILQSTLSLPVEAGRVMQNVDTSRMKLGDRRGTMGEWAVALGLGLRRTIGPFKPRDGRPRGAPAPVLDSEPAEEAMAQEAAHA